MGFDMRQELEGILSPIKELSKEDKTAAKAEVPIYQYHYARIIYSYIQLHMYMRVQVS